MSKIILLMACLGLVLAGSTAYWVHHSLVRLARPSPVAALTSSTTPTFSPSPSLSPSPTLKISPTIELKKPLPTQSTVAAPASSPTPKSLINNYWHIPCQSNPNVTFTHDFTDQNLISQILPPIITADLIRDRSFLWIDRTKTQSVPIYMPVDGDLISGVYKHSKDTLYDYDFKFQVSCERWFFINHVHDPIDSLKALLPATPAETTANAPMFKPPIHFKAGDLLGTTTGTTEAHNFDLGVFDLNHTNTLPTSTSDGREKNFVCSFDWFPEAIRGRYLEIINSVPKIEGSVCP